MREALLGRALQLLLKLLHAGPRFQCRRAGNRPPHGLQAGGLGGWNAARRGVGHGVLQEQEPQFNDLANESPVARPWHTGGW